MEHLEQLRPLWLFLSFLGDAASLLFFFSSLFLWAAYQKKPSLKTLYDTLFLIGVGIAVCYVLKVSIGRARPLYLEHNMGPFFAPFSLDNAFHSFPSSHTVAAATAGFASRSKKLGRLFAALVALSRFMLHKHHFSDILAGIVIAYLLVYHLEKVPLLAWLKKRIWQFLEKTMGKSLDLPKKL